MDGRVPHGRPSVCGPRDPSPVGFGPIPMTSFYLKHPFRDPRLQTVTCEGGNEGSNTWIWGSRLRPGPGQVHSECKTRPPLAAQLWLQPGPQDPGPWPTRPGAVTGQAVPSGSASDNSRSGAPGRGREPLTDFPKYPPQPPRAVIIGRLRRLPPSPWRRMKRQDRGRTTCRKE